MLFNGRREDVHEQTDEHVASCRFLHSCIAISQVWLSPALSNSLITRRVSPSNRRATLLELTDAGHAALAELNTLRRSALRAVTALMSNDDRAALLQGTHAFTAARTQLSEHGRP